MPTEQRIELAKATSGVPVFMDDVWEIDYIKGTMEGVVSGKSSFDGYLIIEQQGMGTSRWPTVRLTRPTRFNGLDLEWREGWTYPVAEINGVECTVKLPGAPNSFQWNLVFEETQEEPFWNSADCMLPGWTYACPLNHWCETCQRPKAACSCEKRFECPKCACVHFSETDRDECKCPRIYASRVKAPPGFTGEVVGVDEKHIYVEVKKDHIPSAGKKVEYCQCESPVRGWGGHKGMCGQCGLDISDHSTDAGKKVEMFITTRDIEGSMNYTGSEGDILRSGNKEYLKRDGRWVEQKNDHSVDANKKVEDESSLMNLIRNQSNILSKLITRVKALEESK